MLQEFGKLKTRPKKNLNPFYNYNIVGTFRGNGFQFYLTNHNILLGALMLMPKTTKVAHP